MQKWEYQTCYLDKLALSGIESTVIQDKLNIMGNDGWELIQLFNRAQLVVGQTSNPILVYGVFKRPIQS